jgi:hypothetical protein
MTSKPPSNPSPVEVGIPASITTTREDPASARRLEIR